MSIEPRLEFNHKSNHCLTPVSYRHRPFFRCIHDGEIHHFLGWIIAWKYLPFLIDRPYSNQQKPLYNHSRARTSVNYAPCGRYRAECGIMWMCECVNVWMWECGNVGMWDCGIVGLWDCGKTALIASGKPFRPSTQAIKISCTPRFCSSVSTFNQNFAPSFSAIHMPISLLWPSVLIPKARKIDLLITCLSWRTLITIQSR